MSEFPRYTDFFGPVLDVLEDGQDQTGRVICQATGDLLRITPEQRHETLASGQNTLASRCGWALTYLAQAGCVERPRRGTYRITERGRDLRRSNPEAVTLAHLHQFPEFLDFLNRSRGRAGNSEGSMGGSATSETDPLALAGHAAATSLPDQLTPADQIADAVHAIETAVGLDLVARLRQMPPEFLEKSVLRLLVAMGYGGSEGDAQHLGGPGDGGFDGVINQDRLGLARIYVQAKRYAADNSVGRPDVQAFFGALSGMGASGGVFITTSRFTPDAISFATGINPRMILIDGARLGALMIQYGIGVQETRTVRLVEVDEDFFE